MIIISRREALILRRAAELSYGHWSAVALLSCLLKSITTHWAGKQLWNRQRQREKRSVGSVRTHNRSHHFATQSSHFVDWAGWQAKMASIECCITWHSAHGPHWKFRKLQGMIQWRRKARRNKEWGEKRQKRKILKFSNLLRKLTHIHASTHTHTNKHTNRQTNTQTVRPISDLCRSIGETKRTSLGEESVSILHTARAELLLSGGSVNHGNTSPWRWSLVFVKHQCYSARKWASCQWKTSTPFLNSCKNSNDGDLGVLWPSYVRTHSHHIHAYCKRGKCK